MESRFTGTLLGQIGIGILSAFITGITFGLGAPWATCLSEGWYAKHTIIDGHQLVFDGKGHQLFGNYIKWLILTIITFGIYGFWLSIKMKQWVVMHTHHDDVAAVNTAPNNGVTPLTQNTESESPMSFGDKINVFSQNQSAVEPAASESYSEQPRETYSNIHTDEVADNNYQSPFGSSFNASSVEDEPTVEEEADEDITPSPDYEPEDFHVDADGNTYYLDDNGNPYYLDHNGTPYYIDQDGNPFYIDENGTPFYYDEEGNPHYFED